MSNTSQDCRVQRTRKAIKVAFEKLLKQQDYTNITARQIAQDANVGAMTFYRHFAGKDDLLVAYAAEALQKTLENRLSEEVQLGFAFFEFADKYDWLLCPILLEMHNPTIAYQFNETLSKQLFHCTMSERYIPNDLKIRHITHSIANLVTWWLEGNKPLSVEKMGDIAQKLTFEALHDLCARYEEPS